MSLKQFIYFIASFILVCMLFGQYPMVWAYTFDNPEKGQSCYMQEGSATYETNPFTCFIKLYQRFLSPVNGNKCPMLPSCSRFALDALNERGGVGLIMTFDRLLRCGRDLADYPLIFSNGNVYYYDPVKPKTGKSNR